MYMKHMPLTQISRETGIPRSTLRYYQRQSWEQERTETAKELIGLIRSSTRHELKEIHTLGLRVIYNSLLAIEESGKTMRSVDMLNITKVLQGLDEMAAQEDIKSPGHTDVEDYDVIDMAEMQSLDPFLAPKKEKK